MNKRKIIEDINKGKVTEETLEDVVALIERRMLKVMVKPFFTRLLTVIALIIVIHTVLPS